MDKKVLSEERKRYLKKLRLNKLYIRITQILILVMFIVLWEVLANVGVIDSFITSKPSKIVATFINMLSNGLLEHIGITCLETLIGFLLGTTIGTLIASILWWSPFLSKVASPYLIVLNSLPKVALGPIIIIWGVLECLL